MRQSKRKCMLNSLSKLSKEKKAEENKPQQENLSSFVSMEIKNGVEKTQTKTNKKPHTHTHKILLNTGKNILSTDRSVGGNTPNSNKQFSNTLKRFSFLILAKY